MEDRFGVVVQITDKGEKPMKNTWKYTIELNIGSLLKLENELNIKFPQNYKDFILQNNASYPTKKEFNTVLSTRVLNYFLDLNDIKHIKSLIKILPKDYFPIAIDPFGNYICFNFSNNQEVIFYDLENPSSSEKVADNFQEFIDLLY